MKIQINRSVLFFLFSIFVLNVKLIVAQTSESKIDSFSTLIFSMNKLPKVIEMNRYAYGNVNNNPDISIYFARQSINLCRNNKFKDEKIDALMILGDAFFTKSEYDSAKFYYYKSLDLFEDTTNSLKKANLYDKLGNVNSIYNSNIKSLEYYRLAIDIYTKRSNLLKLAKVETHIGNIYMNLLDYKKALYHYQKSMNIGDSLNDENIKSYAQSQAAIVYDILGDYKNAIKYNLKAISVLKEMGQSSLLINTWCNLANTYAKDNQFKRAKNLLKKSYLLSCEINNLRSQAGSLSILGGVLFMEQKFDSALFYYEKSLSIFKIIGIKENITYNQVLISSICIEAGYYNKSKTYLLDALNNAKELKNIMLLSECYKNLSFISKSQNDYKNALKYYELFHVYMDSVSLSESRMHLGELEAKYQTKLKAKENIMLSQSLLFEKKENEKNKEYSKLMTILFFGIVLLLILVIAFLYIYRKSSKRKLIVAKLENENAIEKLKRINSEILAKALIASKVSKGFNKLAGKIKELKKTSTNENKILFKKIDYLLSKTGKELKDFSDVEKELYLANINFHKKLLKINPDFSPAELKLCALLQMNLSTKEVCGIIYRSPRTVEGLRYTIRKKLNIDSKVNLHTYLMKIGE